MRKIVLYFLVVIFAIACNQKESSMSVINGDTKGIEKGIATICSSDAANIVLDSAIVQDGKFALNVDVEIPNHYYVFVQADNDENLAFISNIFLGGGETVMLTAEVGVDNYPNVINAPLQDESKEYKKQIDSQEEGKELQKLNGAISNAFKDGDKIKVNELDKEKRDLSLKLIKKILNFKENSTTSPVAAYHVFNYAASLPLDDKIEVVNMFPSSATNLHYLNTLKQDIISEKGVALGNSAANFKVEDLDGNEYTLDSFKGKYVFLEFSASWCGWCKKEIPFVREAYHEFEDKNIVFITMNMDDKRDLWEKSVTGDNLEWLCLSNLEGMSSELAKSYNIHGIPMSYVIDPEGKIIQQDVRGNEIIEYLSTVL